MTFGVTSNSPCVSQGNIGQFGRRIYQFIRSHLGFFSRHPFIGLEMSRMIRNFSGTVEPRFNKVAGDRPNLFIKWRVCYIEVLFHTFYCNFGRDIEIVSFVILRTSLNRGSLNRGSTVITVVSIWLYCKIYMKIIVACTSSLFH